MSAPDPRFVRTLTEATAPLVENAGGGDLVSDTAASDIEQMIGREVGRYLVLERIGAGGMGVVLRAHDPELDRYVALKVLTSKSRTHNERLYREAQALARLSHENVVAVHDVGMHEGYVFMAMELIEGQTLSAWLKAEKRSQREILRMFRAAGRGLSAAHGAGLVHRDFKPTNVMVGRDGRVRVLDFGVARTRGDGDGRTPSAVEPGLGTLRLSTPLTLQGMLLGTPLYMAPEQLRQGVVTPASDQFAFCVSLWEALYGARPFAAGSREELLAHITTQTFAPQGQVRVPAWLKKLLVRGLSDDPSARHASMDALLTELEQKPRQRMRRRLFAALSALTVTMGVLGVVYAREQRAATRERCASAGDAIQSVWNPEQKARLASAFSAQSGSYGSDTAERVARLTDAYTRDWQAMSRESCLATWSRGTQTESLLDRRSACLERRRLGLSALLERFVTAGDTDAVSSALPAVYALPKVAECADLEALTASGGLPAAPNARREITRVRAVLARAEAYDLAGQWSEAEALLAPLEGRVRELAWTPLKLEYAELHARVLTQISGRMADAERTYDQALRLAADSGNDHAVAALWVDLIGALGGDIGRPLEALAQRRAAELALSRIHADENDLRRAELSQHVAFAAWRAGRFEEARDLARASLAVRERALGKEHFDVGSSLAVLGLALQGAGDLEAAAQAGERALAVRRSALGKDHPKVGVSLDQLAVVRMRQGRLNDAIALHREATAMQERVLGPDHATLGMSLNNLGSLHIDMGQYDEAERLLTRTLRIFERSLNQDDPDLAIVHLNLGLVALGRRDPEAARAACNAALRIDEAAFGSDTPVLAWEYTCLGEAETIAGAPRAALPMLERALKMRADAVPLELADTQLALARALAALHQEPERARDLADAARLSFAAAGPVGALRMSRAEDVLTRLR